mgnify:FL=1
MPVLPIGTYNLLVYIDREEHPIRVTSQVTNYQGLVQHLQQLTGKQVNQVSIWDESFRQYVPMKSLADIQEYRARLWVETGGVKLVIVTEERDALEWSALREHVDRLGPPREGYVYQLTQAHRILNLELEDQFQQQRKRLIDPSARTQMLFYTNNARPSDQVVARGFALPAVSSPTPNIYGGGIVFATDIDAQPPVNSNLKFLLCEVAVGRALTIHGGDTIAANKFRAFDLNSYDSLINMTHRGSGGTRLDEWVIFNPNQALPRYILTCTIIRATYRPAWNPAVMGCDVHPGESMKLWCVLCRRLICPYCLTIGGHKGHEAKDVGEVAAFEKQVLQRMFATLSRTTERRQDEVSEVERVKLVMSSVCRQGEETVKAACADLHQLVQEQEQRLILGLQAHRQVAVAKLDEGLVAAHELVADLLKKQSDTKALLDVPVDVSQQARMEFLARLNPLLDVLHTPPRYDEGQAAAITVPSLPTVVDGFAEAQDAIRAMQLVDSAGGGATRNAGQRPSRSQQSQLTGGGGSPDGGRLADGGGSSAESPDLLRLRDVETGYMWIVPQIEAYLTAQPPKDVYSDVFTLNGARWELRLTHVSSSAGSVTPPAAGGSSPLDMVAIFLHAAGHQQRMDFRVSIISPKGWFVRQAKNWQESYRGRGWGIKPLIERRAILSTYVHDGVLKVCVTPSSSLY